MAGIRALRKIQLGLEATNTPGAAVVADTIWRGTGTLEDQRETVFPEEDVGFVGGVDRSYVPRLAAALDMDEVEATYEQLPILLTCCFSEDADPTSTDGSGQVYSFAMSTSTTNTINTATIEMGDNQRADEMEYAYVESMRLSGVAGEAVKMSANWRGRQANDCEFTTSISLTPVSEILFGEGKLYIDAVATAPGTTVVSASLVGMDLDINSGLTPIYTDGDQLYFDHLRRDRPEITADLTFEHNASAEAQITAWRAGTPKVVRIEWRGPTLNTAGSTYTAKTVIVDLAGKWESFSKLDEQDGNDVVTGTFRARWNSTAALFAEVTVVNEISGL